MNPQFYTFLEEHKFFNDVEGSVVELGFGHGGTCKTFLDFISRGIIKTDSFWSYDSYEGFPEPTEVDKNSLRNPKKGQWKVPIDVAYKLKEEYSKIDFKIIKGFVEDTLPNTKPEKIKILHVDLDIYPGYKAALDNLYDVVQPGGLIMFDEYGDKYEDGSLRWPGAKLAIDEFLTKINRTQDLVVYPIGKAYIIK